MPADEYGYFRHARDTLSSVRTALAVDLDTPLPETVEHLAMQNRMIMIQMDRLASAIGSVLNGSGLP